MTQTTPEFVASDLPEQDSLRTAMDRAWLVDETEHVRFLLEQVQLNPGRRSAVRDRAVELVRQVRERSRDAGVMEAFMREYDLSSEEGVILMCLAEALLRIPDNETAEKLISDKLSDADWESHLGKSSSVFVNAGTWGLMLTGRMVSVSDSARRDLGSALTRIANKSGEPVVRLAIRQAMRIMGHQYVMGRNIDKALERSRKKANRRFRYSFDMLGEAAMTAEDAERYRHSYSEAIDSIGRSTDDPDIFSAPSISVKLSALHPRYEFTKRDRLMTELVPVLRDLACQARDHNIALTVDAEEADRLTISLDIFAEVLRSPELKGWDGFGLALQAYQKRAWVAIDWLAERARETGHRIPIRLVKGAYWDTEIKLAQIEGLDGYPVFTRKVNTDLSYIACAAKLLSMGDAFYPQFATHNAHTISIITELAGDNSEFEYQRLHGMGQQLYEEVLDNDGFNGECRVYAPVGNHKDLLPYLVRRLLENGANTSFVNRIVDEKLPPEEVVDDPIGEVQALATIPHPKIPLPADIYGKGRTNSRGINFPQESVLAALTAEMTTAAGRDWEARPLGHDVPSTGETVEAHSPADLGRRVGQVRWTPVEHAGKAVDVALGAQLEWDRQGAEHRADVLDRIGDLYEKHGPELMAMCAREAGKTLHDGIAEVREAVDFLRYYAMQARQHMAEPMVMPGPTGEHNELRLHGRGVFVCISPWNFPLAIFTGQVCAALVAGNSVIAKPAEQTPIVATRAVELMHEAGVPAQVLQCLPGDGRLGAALTSDERIAGVAFTGSTETAHRINRTLAERTGSLATLIAETGGQNAMIVDSSALPEQVVDDVIQSAFHSAGQRCSALRILCVQADVADRVTEMLAGAMAQVRLGDPGLLETDVGPVIDQDQLDMLKAHADRMEREGRLIARTPLPEDLPKGYWFAPCAYEIESIDQLEGEVFGPVLHVLRYRARDLDKLLDRINAIGYGLTAGVHSRIDRVQHHIAHRLHVGNAYVNRNMTGAVVGVQPFGGEGLSGTGPKAGGPHYVLRFCTERTLTVNTAAVGGNASLLALSDN
ncbi:bifunctional proline dehydrogenase/L-glutamate gamma-semialdehyde dehydrogenase PutA [Wenzhouxiangella sp. AB-CW3]|uniref:bifunctional proline dehydrogenase/L-glutamate gamma-semialdehyde dehydrogenase PutA n=1 Tax=Wenzhouxiangella sp. AB-CW3 TaxID=2771012 RepID=UPI00168A8E04|nr:bifunctional proline dehydrogenase/L-glutamate gamma-semialdehyde dehydrogenase PutA [Wenzhouxiangella sp. AB-CW3]QOC24020.1 bifunctional proline dehydrogenase/L-glutamate gamma-semialdehyde dehydrogenase PutA [Wenzhouxiangella sp. AB-CW3]